MMGERRVEQGCLFYEFSLERHVPADHILRAIDRFVDLADLRVRLPAGMKVRMLYRYSIEAPFRGGG